MLKNSKYQFIIGLIIYVVSAVLFVTVSRILPKSLGIYGTIITELMFLAMAVVFILIFKLNIKETFKIKKPTWRLFFGSLLILMGFGLFSGLSNIIFARFFPDGAQRNFIINDFLSNVPYLLSLFAVAVLPGICEEALFRGTILKTFHNNKPWVGIIIVGVLFGALHLDLNQFVGLSLIGIALCYIMVKTQNIFYSVAVHMLNNAFTISLLLLLLNPIQMLPDSAQSLELTNVPLASVALIVIFASAAPFLIYSGSKLLNVKPENKEKNKKILITAIVSTCVLFLIGVLLFIAGIIELMQIMRPLIY